MYVDESGDEVVNSGKRKNPETRRLGPERPHQLDGFQTILAARAALHNFCVWLNRQLAGHLWPLPACWVGNSTYSAPSV